IRGSYLPRLRQDAKIAADAEVEEVGLEIFEADREFYNDNYEVIMPPASTSTRRSMASTSDVTDPQGCGLRAKRFIPQYNVVFEDRP
ncbi:unnamed protein product, partial [Amoebophrya sp. A25]